jgi:hypothetical protein
MKPLEFVSLQHCCSYEHESRANIEIVVSTGRDKPYLRKTLEDNEYNVGLANQTSAFEVTIEFLNNYIKRNFDQGNEIAMAIESLEDPDQAQ